MILAKSRHILVQVLCFSERMRCRGAVMKLFKASPRLFFLLQSNSKDSVLNGSQYYLAFKLMLTCDLAGFLYIGAPSVLMLGHVF